MSQSKLSETEKFVQEINDIKSELYTAISNTIEAKELISIEKHKLVKLLHYYSSGEDKINSFKALIKSIM